MPKMFNHHQGKKHLILVGGGHSHAIFLNLWAKIPLKNVLLTLVSDVNFTPYSGMLPGYLAGFYSYQECHINLPLLAQKAGAFFLLDKAVNLDLFNNTLILEKSAPLRFDFISFDLGSTPNIQAIKGAENFAIPLKPIPYFLSVWSKIIANIHKINKLSISIIGGGAGGVELALNFYARLSPFINILNLNLIHSNHILLPNHNTNIAHILEQLLLEKNVNIYLNERVVEIQKNNVVCDSGIKIYSDYTFLVTNASAPKWIKECGLMTDENGFILVNNYLQSLNHKNVFAAGDIATIENYPCPKAGVFAVRQGKPLFNNLSRILTNKKLTPYFPQKNYLSLLGTGEKKAIASWGNFAFYSPFFWTIKDKIDRHFMRQFLNN